MFFLRAIPLDIDGFFFFFPTLFRYGNYKGCLSFYKVSATLCYVLSAILYIFIIHIDSELPLKFWKCYLELIVSTQHT